MKTDVSSGKRGSGFLEFLDSHAARYPKWYFDPPNFWLGVVVGIAVHWLSFAIVAYVAWSTL